MPIYEYRCLDCKQAYEKREGFEAPALQQCPTCGGTARRVFHPAPIVFKGSGFYVTDNRKPDTADKSTPAAESEAKVESPPEADKAASADKPAAAGKADRDAEPAAAS